MFLCFLREGKYGFSRFLCFFSFLGFLIALFSTQNMRNMNSNSQIIHNIRAFPSDSRPVGRSSNLPLLYIDDQKAGQIFGHIHIDMHRSEHSAKRVGELGQWHETGKDMRVTRGCRWRRMSARRPEHSPRRCPAAPLFFSRSSNRTSERNRTTIRHNNSCASAPAYGPSPSYSRQTTYTSPFS